MPAIAIPAIAPLPIPGLDLPLRVGLGREVRVERGGVIVVVAPRFLVEDGEFGEGVVGGCVKATVLNKIAWSGAVLRDRMNLSTVRADSPPVIVTSVSRSLENRRSSSDGDGLTVMVVSKLGFQYRTVVYRTMPDVVSTIAAVTHGVPDACA